MADGNKVWVLLSEDPKTVFGEGLALDGVFTSPANAIKHLREKCLEGDTFRSITWTIHNEGYYEGYDKKGCRYQIVDEEIDEPD